MSNSPLICYTKLSPNRNSPRNHVIDTITIHCTAGQCTVEGLGDIFAPSSRQASSNYGIGSDGRIAMYVPEGDRSWCTSSWENDHRAVTIEVSSDSFHPYAVTAKAYSALMDLCEDICRRNGIAELNWRGDRSLIGQVDKQNMTVHRWFANKACPGDWLYERHGEIAAEVNRRLNANNNKSDKIKMDKATTPDVCVREPDDKFVNDWRMMRKNLQDNDCGEWSAEARKWAIENGIVEGGAVFADGTPNYMWEDILTREQFVTVLWRFAKLMGRG